MHDMPAILRDIGTVVWTTVIEGLGSGRGSLRRFCNWLANAGVRMMAVAIGNWTGPEILYLPIINDVSPNPSLG